MSSEQHEILMFEDTEQNFEDIRRPLQEHDDLTTFDIKRFPPDKIEPDDWEGDEEETPEATDILYPYLEEPHPDLVVLDWDLGGFKSGIRRQHVRSGCEEFGIPLCVYHRDEGQYSNPDELKEYDEDLIRIDVKESSSQVAGAIATIASSFVDIHKAIRDNEVGGLQGALEQVVEVPPSTEAQLEQYSLGQSTALQVAKSEMSEEWRDRVISTLIGYWIHNQLLEYPGVLLNEVATASHLGVNHEEFQQKKPCYIELKKAEYDGPFSDLERDNWWWTNLLDEIRVDLPTDEEGGLLSGTSLFEELCDEEMEEVRCVEEGEPKAGYYCILTEEPVCKEHSKQPSDWIPVGASKSRISTSKFEEISGWVAE